MVSRNTRCISTSSEYVRPVGKGLSPYGSRTGPRIHFAHMLVLSRPTREQSSLLAPGMLVVTNNFSPSLEIFATRPSPSLEARDMAAVRTK